MEIYYFVVPKYLVTFTFARFCDDFYDMTGYYPNIVWKILWVGVTPLSLGAILIYSLVDQLQNPIMYGAFVGCTVSLPWLSGALLYRGRRGIAEFSLKIEITAKFLVCV